MSIIIRLQNLPWSANAMDIRQFFNGLQIPEGGVHIVGGELGDAFIAFSTDEDARQAFLRSNGTLKGVQVKLMLSSRSEMHRIIEEARNQCLNAFTIPPISVPTPAQISLLPAAVPHVMPAAVPALPAKDYKERSESNGDKRRDARRRSRSRSRDRRDRSRDKSRRHRERSRTRSRDRRDRDGRRRRERSRSRTKSRDKVIRRDLDRRDGQKKPEPWANAGPAILTPSPWVLNTETVKKALVANLQANLGLGGLQAVDNQVFRNNILNTVQAKGRESWPAANPPSVRESLVKSPIDYPSPPLVTKKFMDNSHGLRDNQYNNNQKQHVRVTSPSDGQRSFAARVRENGKRSRFDIDPFANTCISIGPFYGPYADLRQFFNGLAINYQGIKIIHDDKGDKTGICYVRFRDSGCKQKALLMNGRSLNQVNVNIKHVDDDEFERAIDAYKPFQKDRPYMEDLESGCLKVENLPKYVKEQDILHIFSQYQLTSLYLNCKPKGGSIAYVKFDDKSKSKVALQQKSLHFIGNKPVNVKPCDIKEFIKANMSEIKHENSIQTACLSFGNLPSGTTESDISNMLSEIDVVPSKIHLLDNMGYVGQAYCELKSEEDAAKALSESKIALGQNVISVEPISFKELNAVLKKDTVQSPRISPLSTAMTKTEQDANVEIENENGTNAGSKIESESGQSKEEESTNTSSKIQEAIKKFKEEALRASQQPMQDTGRDVNDRRKFEDPDSLSGRFEPPSESLKSDNDNEKDFDSPRLNFDEPKRSSDHRGDSNESRRHYDEPRSHHDDARPHYDEDRSHYDDVRPHYSESRSHYDGARRHYDEARPHYDEDRSHHDDIRSHHDDIRSHHDDIRSHHDEDRTHYDDDISLHDEDRPHYDEARSHYDEGRSHFDDSRPHYGEARSHFDKLGHHFDDPRGPRGFMGLRGGIFESRGGNFAPHGAFGPGGEFFRPRGGFGPRGRGGLFGPRGGPRFNVPDDETPEEEDELPGCTVYMDNVPYKAGTTEILEFFKGYNSTEHVSRRYNANNTPSGEAKVSFYNPDDAARAVRELNEHTIWNRTIYLTQK